MIAHTMQGVTTLMSCAILACSTTPKPVGAPLSEDRVQFPTFSVGVPTGSGWGVHRDDQKLFVEFLQVRPVSVWEAGAGREKFVALRVFAIPFVLDKPQMPSEEAIADAYLHTEEETLRVAPLNPYDYKVKVVAKGKKTIGHRSVHFMRYHTGGRTAPVGGIYLGIDALLYVYFPPSIEKSGAYYGFMAEQTCKHCDLELGGDDLSQLDRLVNSFEAK